MFSHKKEKKHGVLTCQSLQKGLELDSTVSREMNHLDSNSSSEFSVLI